MLLRQNIANGSWNYFRNEGQKKKERNITCHSFKKFPNSFFIFTIELKAMVPPSNTLNGVVGLSSSSTEPEIDWDT